jgi:adenine-specific DNA-methyltransferase
VSRLTDLIAGVKAKDSRLGADLEHEFRALSSRLSFGLNFERHTPESVELPGRPIRRGDKVRILPPRSSTKNGDQRLWVVKKIAIDRKYADLELLDLSAAARYLHEQTKTSAPLEDVVVVAQFRDVIYPGLISTGKVSRGGDKRPWHTVINGENYHALKALTWTHRGKVDAVYIDPPYNSGARDWKYNNDYVESDDQYRHSKWLAMMERRLLVARELLNPAGSVLIVTIDEKEYLRLGLLLEQLFPEAERQMITTVISRNGTSREGEFSRVEEYLFMLRVGRQPIVRTNDNMLASEGKSAVSRIWFNFMRTSTPREDLEGQFYPIVVNVAERRIVGIGEPSGKGNPRVEPKLGKNEVAVWPIRQDGGTATWGAIVPTARQILAEGYLRVGDFDELTKRWSLNFVREGDRRRVSEGIIRVVGTRPDGSKELEYADLSKRESYPKTVWNRVSHDATSHGTRLLKELLPGRRFPYPKSLYAVEDALRFFVANKPEAVILDFFAGSGTTAHALMRLNKQDGGNRQCISVTNNEVAADEQKALREKGLRPGDPEWEQLGICDHITKPRVAAAITGRTPDGKRINDDYKFTDEFPTADGFEANAEFFTLTYETPVGVSYQTAFARIAPLLWLRAGSVGRRIDKVPAAGWEVVETYGLLVDLDKATDFLKAVRKTEGVGIAYIVTDDERRFQSMARRLPDGVEPIRLYESYLTNFAFANAD